MITWLTRLSLFDSAEDLEIPQAALAVKHSQELFSALVFGEQPETWPEAWERHPCRQMWVGYEPALAAYCSAVSVRLVAAGIVGMLAASEVSRTVSEMRQSGDLMEYVAPPWSADTDVLLSHRSNLQRRWPKAYRKTWKGVPIRMPYIWPFCDDEGGYRLMLSKGDKQLLADGERSLPSRILERIHNR